MDGYHAGLWVTIALLAVGVVLSYVTLRPAKPHNLITTLVRLTDIGQTHRVVSPRR